MTSFKRFFFLSLLTVFATTSAHAGKSEKKAGDPYVKLSSVALPLIENNHVVNYVFMSVQINLTPSAKLDDLRAKEPYFRDALIRTAHKQSFALQNSRNEVDPKLLAKIMTPEFTKIAGPGTIKSIEILSQGARQTLR
jgi:flagellar basal body-associated protein FliL